MQQTREPLRYPSPPLPDRTLTAHRIHIQYEWLVPLQILQSVALQWCNPPHSLSACISPDRQSEPCNLALFPVQWSSPPVPFLHTHILYPSLAEAMKAASTSTYP